MSFHCSVFFAFVSASFVFNPQYWRTLSISSRRYRRFVVRGQPNALQHCNTRHNNFCSKMYVWGSETKNLPCQNPIHRKVCSYAEPTVEVIWDPFFSHIRTHTQDVAVNWRSIRCATTFRAILQRWWYREHHSPRHHATSSRWNTSVQQNPPLRRTQPFVVFSVTCCPFKQWRETTDARKKESERWREVERERERQKRKQDACF